MQHQNVNVYRAIKNRQEVSLVYCTNQTKKLIGKKLKLKHDIVLKFLIYNDLGWNKLITDFYESPQNEVRILCCRRSYN